MILYQIVTQKRILSSNGTPSGPTSLVAYFLRAKKNCKEILKPVIGLLLVVMRTS